MIQQNNITGYTLLKEEKLEDVKGIGLYYKHIKSGARVCVIKNEDENKVFCISFRTPPKDSTGVPHIIEHTVLCGSEKFPVKDPFNELDKGSLNTFLNAMTYPDKTMYPVASCNDKDFANLTDVYLDACFHPLLYKKPEIFKQEGWHYELESEDDEIKLNGIVYSEMKGAYSSPDDRFYDFCTQYLFPDTTYGKDSGGDPAVIPSLTYENYLAFHKKYYHPSNSYIYIYGDIDINERLTWLDKEYLSKYEKTEIDSALERQKEFGKIKEVVEYYSVDEPDKSGKGAFYSLNMFAGETDDLVKGISFEVLDYALFSAPGAPVRQALLDAGIGDDIVSFYSGNRLQPSFTIGVRNAKPGQAQEFRKVVTEALKKCVKDGIKDASIRAAINTQEFRYREADFGRMPKGLMYCMTCLSTWLYDDNMPFTTLHMNEAYDEIKQKIGTDWFENLIEEYFLNSKHGTLLSVLPKVGLNKAADNELKNRLSAYKASLSEVEIKQLISDTKALRAYQSEGSSAEALATIPLLSLSDIKKESRDYCYKEVLQDFGKVLYEEYDTNGVCYIKAFFNVCGVKTEDAGYIGLLSDCLSLIDTKKHTYQELNDLVNIYTGGIGTDTGVFRKIRDYKWFRPYMSVGVKTMIPEAERAMGFLKEVVCESLFEDEKRIKELLFMIRSNIESDMMYNGTGVARTRVNSYFDEAACFVEATDGVDFYDFICRLTDNFESMKSEICAKLKETAAEIFKKGNCLLNITADKEGFTACEGLLRDFMQVLPGGESPDNMRFTPIRRNEGFKTSGLVQYNVLAGHIYPGDFEYTGILEVLKAVLTNDYLYYEVRIKGGAYGTGLFANMLSGIVSMYSYRDPSLKKTYDIFEKITDYLEKYEASEREMTKAKIGVFGTLDAPLTPRQLGERSLGAYVSGMVKDDIQKIRDGVFSCTLDDLRRQVPLLKKVISQGYHCTVGSTEEIDNNSDFYLSTRVLM